jgi:hypothetical protein
MTTKTAKGPESYINCTDKGIHKGWTLYKANNYQGSWWAVSADGKLRVRPTSTKGRVTATIDQHIFDTEF